MKTPLLPPAPNSIQKGIPLTSVLERPAIEQLAANLSIGDADFKADGFIKMSCEGLEPLSIKERAAHIAEAMKAFLPRPYSKAIQVILASLTPARKETTDLGMAVMFYMPHTSYIEKNGLDLDYNDGKDPFDVSMTAQYELTKRFTSEFSIRPFIIDQPVRTFEVLYTWMKDPDPHVRRLCSEGSRPRLPWAQKIDALVKDPQPSLRILEELKDDADLYVRRSVANHVGDIAKDHLELALQLCENWLEGASKERKWVIRHALRNPDKKGITEASQLRSKAK